MSIKYIITPKQKDIDDFSVRRLLPYSKQTMVGPWIFFDHMGPTHFPAGNGINVRPHPHINLATVTYLFEGEIFHRDSLGNQQSIYPGDINLMIAGKGITHSERERDDIRNSMHTLHGLQLWHVLPEDIEECEPEFYHYNATVLPRVLIDGVSVRVMIGTAYDESSPVKTFAKTLYLEAFLKTGQTLMLPESEQLAIYVACGLLETTGKEIEAYSMAILQDNSTVTVKALKPTQIAVIGGEKMTERFIEWNFVSSRKERIEQAKQDWRDQLFPKIVGDENEFIPLPDKNELSR